MEENSPTREPVFDMYISLFRDSRVYILNNFAAKKKEGYIIRMMRLLPFVSYYSTKKKKFIYTSTNKMTACLLEETMLKSLCPLMRRR